MAKWFNAGLIMATIAFASCNETKTETSATSISKKDWGEVDGKQVYLYTLTNKAGDVVTISNYGGIVTSWTSPDKGGNKSSIIIGFDSLSTYRHQPPYFGALIGRYGNRI